MKKLLLLLLVVPLFSYSLNAQAVGAKRYTLFEHFTQASCGPCAAQNPIFAAFYGEHLADARHIAFHTSWPGVDPMYSFNPAPVDAMVGYYGVSGVPDMYANGTGIGSPVSANADMLNVSNSPIRIKVTDEDNAGTHNVTVEIQTVTEVPAGTYFMRVGVVEKLIHYNTAPGSNGEKDFPNVYRDWLANEIAYEPAVVGESVTFTYEYTIDAAWDASQIYTMAYIVNSASKEVLNAGTSYDSSLELLNNTENNIVSGSADGNQFDAIVFNTGSTSESVVVTLESDQPADWSATFSIGGTEYTDMTTLDAAAGLNDLHVNVTSGSSAGIGKYSISVALDGSDEKQTLNYVVIKGITDLVVAASSPDVDIVTPYTSGLAAANNTTSAAISVGGFMRAMNSGALSDLNNIYLSIGWTFPALSDDLVAMLSTFLDNGGNLLIAGQDLGWDVMSGHSSSNGTTAQKAFYTDYLQVAYDDDGSPSANSFTMVEEDEFFGAIGGSSILNVYGGQNLYPDHVHNATDNGTIFLEYNDNGGGAVRVETEQYKVVYFGIGLEHVGDSEVADLLVKTSHDWFYNIVGTKDFDRILSGLSLQQNTPNPANDKTIITINGQVDQASSFEVIDLTGKVIMTQDIRTGEKEIEVNTSALSSGLYFYHIINSEGQTISKKMVVTH